MSIFTAFFYVALWNFADDAGRGRASAKELNGVVFSKRDDVENSQVECALLELAEAGRILLYMDGDDRLFQICRWAEHQVINRPSKSKFPKPDGFHEPSLHLNSDSVNPHGTLTEGSHNPQCWEGGRRKAEGGKGIRKAEGGSGKGECEGETLPSDPQEVSAPPASAPPFGTSAVPPPPPELSREQLPERPQSVHLTDEEMQDLLKSCPARTSECWTRQEVRWALEIVAERPKKPTKLKNYLHSSILPEVRAGKRPQGATANAPPVAVAVPAIDPEAMARLEAGIAERKTQRERALAMIEAGRGEQTNATAN